MFSFSWKEPGEVGLPNVSGQQCFMSVVFQMLFCQRSLRQQLKGFLRDPRRMHWFHSVSEAERGVLQVFWYLLGFRKQTVPLETMVMLYRLGWKQETRIQEQDAREFLHSLVDHFSNESIPSIIRKKLVPRYSTTKDFLCFSWTNPDNRPGCSGKEILEQCRLPCLEPKYPKDPPYSIDFQGLRTETYFWLEVHSTEEVDWGEVNEFSFGSRSCQCIAAALQSNHHYLCVVQGDESGDWTLVDDARIIPLPGGWTTIHSWLSKYACLLLFQWDTLKNN